jgi:hypothetical protein
MSDEPLTPEERETAAKIVVFTVWYKDVFGDGDAFAMSISLTEADARADYDRRIREGSNKAFVPGYDGIVIEGPAPLFPTGMIGCPVRTVREVLRRAAKGIGGAVPVPFK